VTAEELCQRFRIARQTLNQWRLRYPTFPPPIGRTRAARYTRAHVEWIEAHLALRHASVSTAAADAYCLEEGISLADYVQQRHTAFKQFGIGAA
jgi:DNA-binding transcriptional MerR regulator